MQIRCKSKKIFLLPESRGGGGGGGEVRGSVMRGICLFRRGDHEVHPLHLCVASVIHPAHIQ